MNEMNGGRHTEETRDRDNIQYSTHISKVTEKEYRTTNSRKCSFNPKLG